jgi:hypothetical protein
MRKVEFGVLLYLGDSLYKKAISCVGNTETQAYLSRIAPSAYAQILLGIQNCLNRGIHVKTNSFNFEDQECPEIAENG